MNTVGTTLITTTDRNLCARDLHAGTSAGAGL